MSTTHELHRGMVFRHDGHLFPLLDYSVSQSGKQRPTGRGADASGVIAHEPLFIKNGDRIRVRLE